MNATANYDKICSKFNKYFKKIYFSIFLPLSLLFSRSLSLSLKPKIALVVKIEINCEEATSNLASLILDSINSISLFSSQVATSYVNMRFLIWNSFLKSLQTKMSQH